MDKYFYLNRKNQKKINRQFYKKVLICLCFVLLLGVTFIFGCSTVNLTDHSLTSISEYRKNLFVGKTGNVLATYTTGQREQDYIMDGKKTQLTDFGVLTLYFSSPVEKAPEFKLTINDTSYESVLELNPYDGTYVYDTLTQIDDGSQIELYIKDYDQTIKLVCVSSSWGSTYQDAISIFSQKYQKELDSHSKNGVFNGEVYVKIVSSNKSLDNIYWYVLCVCESGDMYSALIDPNTKVIVQSWF